MQPGQRLRLKTTVSCCIVPPSCIVETLVHISHFDLHHLTTSVRRPSQGTSNNGSRQQEAGEEGIGWRGGGEEARPDTRELPQPVRHYQEGCRASTVVTAARRRWQSAAGRTSGHGCLGRCCTFFEWRGGCKRRPRGVGPRGRGRADGPPLRREEVLFGCELVRSLPTSCLVVPLYTTLCAGFASFPFVLILLEHAYGEPARFSSQETRGRACKDGQTYNV